MSQASTYFSLIYKILSILYLPPSYHDQNEIKQMLQELKNPEKTKPIELLCPELVETLYDFIQHIEESYNDKYYKADLTRVFISSYDKTPCPPYESIYTGQLSRHRSILLPHVVSRLRSFYKRLGVESTGLPGITVDHLSTELEYMALVHELLSKPNDTILYNDLEKIRKEFVGHLLTWIPVLVECIENNAESELLKMQARLLDELVRCDEKLIDIQLS
ncbi:MAG: molecular chaperone TorD family protein [Desulfurococcales archaeon]|nr:molecular chaperone TorD family protein [Desulfurococcales archaeon]MEB3788839.1 molecular chaperone TorD family protein [Desulfurococcales archaeon]